MFIFLYRDDEEIIVVHLPDAKTVLDCVASKTLWDAINRSQATHWKFR